MGGRDDDRVSGQHHDQLPDRLARGGPSLGPGDGSEHEASNLTILTHAGAGLWSREEDIYNPMRFAKMSLRWARTAQEHGRLTQDSREFLAKLGG